MNKEKIKSLSERLQHIAKEKSPVRRYNNPKIKSQNLKHNITTLIAHILIDLKFAKRSKRIFQHIIQEYNKANRTSLKYGDFTDIHWVKEINGEILMPSAVRHYIWNIGDDEKQNKPIKLPQSKKDLIKCLQIYYKRYYKNSKLTISKHKLTQILKSFSNKNLSIDFLVEENILEYNTESKTYFWKDSEYSRQLGNEIASLLWLLITEEQESEVEFIKFFKIIVKTGIIVDDLGEYLNNSTITRITEYAISFLHGEKDLLESENEFKKDWLDSPNYRHIDINKKIPDIRFNYENSYDFIKSVKYNTWYYRYIYDHQETRSFCYILLRILVNNDRNNSSPYSNILNIFKDTTRPFLVWVLFSQTAGTFPELLPYLLTEIELIPIAFLLINKLNINESFIKESYNHDQKYKEKCDIKNQIWLELFDILLEYLSSSKLNFDKGEIITKILLDTADKVFSLAPTNTIKEIEHLYAKKKYDEAIKKISLKRIVNHNIHPKPLIHPRLIFNILFDAIRYLKDDLSNRKPSRTGFLNLCSGYLDLAIEILRMTNFPTNESEISIEEQTDIKRISYELTLLLNKSIIEFYTINKVDVLVHPYDISKKRNVIRGIGEFGFEIIDWGYAFLNFQKHKILVKLNDKFIASLNFNLKADKYDDRNKEQLEKIRIYLKSMLLAYLTISRNKEKYEIDKLPVEDTLTHIENITLEFALKYSVDNLLNAQIDVFSETYRVLGSNLYYKPLLSLLFECVNYFPNEKREKLVKDFFENTNDIGRMLNAFNIIENKQIKNTISKYIKGIDIEDFIESRFTLTELEATLVDAINSDNHWGLAKPLINRIKKHFEKRSLIQEKVEYFLYEVNMLLALKENNFQKLESIAVPKEDNYSISNINKGENKKRFFIALFKIYNNKEYDEAILNLKSLLSNENENITYAYHLFHAETLKAKKDRDTQLLRKANDDWQEFEKSITGEKIQELASLTEYINLNKLYYYVEQKDTYKFDQAISYLSNKNLYDEEIIELIYSFYIERDLYELAFDYINKANAFYKQNEIDIPENLRILKSKILDENTISKLKLILSNLPSQRYDDIPRILPNNLNGEMDLNHFVLKELIQASTIMIQKIESIRQITHENRYNDLLIAILKLRLPIWGWNIEQESRIGTTQTVKSKYGEESGGKDAGSADFLVQSAGINFALWEALILKDKDYTKKHILKCYDYAKSISYYYIIVYVTKRYKKFENACKNYTEHVLNIDYPDDFSLDKSYGFINITSQFKNIDHLYIGKTKLSDKKEMFHIIINLTNITNV